MLSSLYQELIKEAFTLAAAGLAAWIALRLYFRQKEYDLIKERYLEGAVDILAGEVEQVLGVVRPQLAARRLNIVKAFRDEKTDFDLEELEKRFLEPDSSRFHRVAHHRIGNLAGTQVIWYIYQLAMAFAGNANTKITKEISEMLRLKLTTNRIIGEQARSKTAMFNELKGSHRAT